MVERYSKLYCDDSEVLYDLLSAMIVIHTEFNINIDIEIAIKTPKGYDKVEPVIRMSPEHISVEILKFEFNLGSNWKMQCCNGQTHS